MIAGSPPADKYTAWTPFNASMQALTWITSIAGAARSFGVHACSPKTSKLFSDTKRLTEPTVQQSMVNT
eukprot:997641-Pelagomonas_calceolata.AAC.1